MKTASVTTQMASQPTSELPSTLPSPMTSQLTSELPSALPSPIPSQLTSELPSALNLKTTELDSGTTTQMTFQMNSEVISDPTSQPAVGAEGEVPGSHDQEPPSHEYELIKAADPEYSEVDAYKIQQCSAYGVPSSSALHEVM